MATSITSSVGSTRDAARPVGGTSVGRDLRLARRQAIRRGDRVGAARLAGELARIGEGTGGIVNGNRAREFEQAMAQVDAATMEQMNTPAAPNALADGGAAPPTTPDQQVMQRADRLGISPEEVAMFRGEAPTINGVQRVDLSAPRETIDRAFGPLAAARRQFAEQLRNTDMTLTPDIQTRAAELGVSDEALSRFGVKPAATPAAPPPAAGPTLNNMLSTIRERQAATRAALAPAPAPTSAAPAAPAAQPPGPKTAPPPAPATPPTSGQTIRGVTPAEMAGMELRRTIQPALDVARVNARAAGQTARAVTDVATFAPLRRFGPQLARSAADQVGAVARDFLSGFRGR